MYGCAGRGALAHRYALSATCSVLYPLCRSLALRMAPRKAVHPNHGAQLQWKIYGHRDDEDKIKISQDGLELQMTDAPTDTIQLALSKSIHSEPGDPFYVEFRLTESSCSMDSAQGPRYNV